MINKIFITKQLVQVHRAEAIADRTDKPPVLEATRTSAQSRRRSLSTAQLEQEKQLVQVHRAEVHFVQHIADVVEKQLVQVHRAEGHVPGHFAALALKQLVQVHRAEVFWRLDSLMMPKRSNSYKCTEQKETFLCFLGMGNNPMVGATVAVAVATAEAMNK